jgi:hypothetical protein
MKVLVQGTKDFTDYQVLMRAMGVALSSMKPGDKEFQIYCVGPHKTNDLALSFANLTEDNLKGRGIKVKFHRLPAKLAEDKIDRFDYMAYLSNPENRRLSALTNKAEENGVELGIFRY